MSSNGIIDAVANALGISYTNTNSQMKDHKMEHHKMKDKHGYKGSRMY